MASCALAASASCALAALRASAASSSALVFSAAASMRAGGGGERRRFRRAVRPLRGGRGGGRGDHRCGRLGDDLVARASLLGPRLGGVELVDGKVATSAITDGPESGTAPSDSGRACAEADDARGRGLLGEDVRGGERGGDHGGVREHGGDGDAARHLLLGETRGGVVARSGAVIRGVRRALGVSPLARGTAGAAAARRLGADCASSPLVRAAPSATPSGTSTRRTRETSRSRSSTLTRRLATADRRARRFVNCSRRGSETSRGSFRSPLLVRARDLSGSSPRRVRPACVRCARSRVLSLGLAVSRRASARRSFDAFARRDSGAGRHSCWLESDPGSAVASDSSLGLAETHGGPPEKGSGIPD